VRYCARPPLAQERLGRLNDELLFYRLRRPALNGRTELILTPLELLDRLAHLVIPPRIHKHRHCGVPAPNAKLRRAVTAAAGPAGATLQLIERILTHIGEPATPPAVLPARAPPQAEMGFEPADRSAAQMPWLEIDQTGGQGSWD
jgi:hypothetical protein